MAGRIDQLFRSFELLPENVSKAGSKGDFIAGRGMDVVGQLEIQVRFVGKFTIVPERIITSFNRLYRRIDANMFDKVLVLYRSREHQ